MFTTHEAHSASIESRDVAPVRVAIAPAATPRREHRARDFGIGYGNSSGYASHRRYASNWGEPRFRFT